MLNQLSEADGRHLINLLQGQWWSNDILQFHDFQKHLDDIGVLGQTSLFKKGAEARLSVTDRVGVKGTFSQMVAVDAFAVVTLLNYGNQSTF